MIRVRLHTGLALLALMLGLVHCGLTLSAPSFTVDLLWFAGAGAAIVCVALSNVLRGAPTPTSSLNLIIQNTVITAFFCAAWLVFPAPQVIAGGILFGAMTPLAVSALWRAPALA